MPLTRTNTGNAIRGRVVPNANQREDCHGVIAQLTFQDIGRGAGTLHTVGTARLDMQGHTPAGANVQVQIGEGTAAAVLIADSTMGTTDPMNQAGVRNGAIAALNQSLDSGTIWTLTGSLP